MELQEVKPITLLTILTNLQTTNQQTKSSIKHIRFALDFCLLSALPSCTEHEQDQPCSWSEETNTLT